ncbi:Pyrroloquinoline quinone biosynthesis protein B [Tenacibaculum sp. 190524A02b]|uniref:MBL fold metallo-hydrolase n=1 Tax=Tenacibaculum vairaonense TaxID=3137860 RepID=UPI0032B2C0F9
MKKYIFLLFIIFASSCIRKNSSSKPEKNSTKNLGDNSISIVILGTIQDAGSPQIGCKKKCCDTLFKSPKNDRMVSSIGVIDNINNKSYLFDASPDIAKQIDLLLQYKNININKMVDGIFLTHAHIGHYTGLMFLGKEAMNANKVPVFTMPRMKEYIKSNGPWNQLVRLNNITLKELTNNNIVKLSNEVEVIPFLVPHRDEYSETVGYKIIGPNKSALFIPDIDKWEKWEKDIVDEIKNVDYAFLDATFYSGKEINNRDISQIPHPFVIESLKKFEKISKEDKSKIVFIHFNHTNPLINDNSDETKKLINLGFRVANINDVFEL